MIPASLDRLARWQVKVNPPYTGSLPTQISKTTPCKVAGGRWHGCLTCENILTRRANHRHNSIIAQFVKSPMALPVEIAVPSIQSGSAIARPVKLNPPCTKLDNENWPATNDDDDQYVYAIAL
jgi:hypothetical protein